VPVNVVQHPLHPGMVVFERRLHRRILRGDTKYTLADMARSTDLAVWQRQALIRAASHPMPPAEAGQARPERGCVQSVMPLGRTLSPGHIAHITIAHSRA
jgi:hypothetical protein